MVQIDLAGGAALMSNFVPKNQGGQLLNTYSRMGLGKKPELVSVFVGASFHSRSKILEGIIERTSSETRANTSMFGVCVQSGDDRDSNFMAINGMLQKLGANGSLLPHTGTVNSASKGRHRPALVSVEGGLTVNSFDTLVSSLGFSSTLDNLSRSQKEKLTKLTQRLNESQANKLARESGAKILSEIVGCAAQKSADILSSPQTAFIDPKQNEAFKTIWELANNTLPNNESLVFASLVYNSLKKNSGSTTIQLAGYDYHGLSPESTDSQDKRAGELIGRVLASAQALNTPVYIIVTSDGSVGSAASDTIVEDPEEVRFNTDRGLAGGLYSFIYNPSRIISLKKTQIGYFEEGQLASEKSVIGSNTERAMAAIILNYLALHGHDRVRDLERILGQQIFTNTQLNEVILIDS